LQRTRPQLALPCRSRCKAIERRGASPGSVLVWSKFGLSRSVHMSKDRTKADSVTTLDAFTYGKNQQ